jgi:hypothetical protein
MTVKTPTALPGDECIELNLVSANLACPVTFNTTRSLRFDVTAHTQRDGLTWRRAATSSDVLTPSGGAIGSNGVTSVLVNDLVLDGTVTFEIVDGNDVLLSFTLRHY